MCLVQFGLSSQYFQLKVAFCLTHRENNECYPQFSVQYNIENYRRTLKYCTHQDDIVIDNIVTIIYFV